MKSKKEIFIGLGILVVLIGLIIGIKTFMNKGATGEEDYSDLNQVYVATGGGKENFIADEDVNKIIHEKYKMNVVYDNWSNGKTVLWPLVRESVGKGNKSIADELSKNHFAYTVTSSGVSKYDALFTSDQRFYDYFKVTPATRRICKRKSFKWRTYT